MSDVQLSVEVQAKMKSLSDGLKKGKDDINDFVTSSIPGLENLQRVLNSLGVNTSAQGLKEFSKAARAMAASSGEASASLLAQRTATEAQRTAAARSRAEIVAHSAATRTNRTAVMSASGSYDESRRKLTELGRQIRAAGGLMNNTNPAIRSMIREYDALNDSLKKVDASMGNHQRKVGDYSGAINGAMTAMGGMAAGYLSASALLSAAFSTALRTDSIKTSLEFTFNSVDVAKEKMDGLRFTANRLGLEYISLSDSYRSFAGAAVASNFPLKETDRIFNSVANAGAKMKLTTDQVSGALTALQQMISKGTVQSEELRGQLGERLPGAFAIAARAMGVTQQELGKLLQDGKVLAADLLPKLADELDKTFRNDVNERVESLSGSVNRVKNSFTEMVETKGAISGFFTFVIDRAGGVVEGLNKMSQALGIFYELAKDPKGFIGDSAKVSRSKSYTDLQENVGSQAVTAVKNEGDKSSTLVRIQKEIDLLKELDVLYKKRKEDYGQIKAGDRSLTDTKTFKNSETALKAQILFVRGLKSEYQRLYAEAPKSAEAALTSIAAIRKEITRLSALDGSATKGSDVFNKIAALKAQLKDLGGSKDKPATKVFDTIERQLTDFHNRANIITKQGLAKDLQEWDDKYGKIKAAIDKLPAGGKKAAASADVESQYKDGRANIIEANTLKIQEAIRKRNESINAADLDGMAKEIESVNAHYSEQIRLAEGNKDGVTALKKQQAEEISQIERNQAAADSNTIVKQMADIAMDYREHQAEMYEIAITNGSVAAEIADNEKLKDELKKSYLDRLIDFETYQNELAKLVQKGNDLEIKPPIFDIKHFQDVVLDAQKTINGIMQNFIDAGIASTLSDSFSNVGQAIAEGGNIISAAGKSMQASFGELMKALGKQYTTMGVAKMAAGALMSPFGWKEIGQGAGLIALGASLSIGGGIVGSIGGGSSGKADKGLPQFAMGRDNFGGGLAIVGERGPEVVNIPTGSHVIPNHKVIQGLSGGGGGQVMIPEVRLSGQDIYIAFKRTEKNNKRG